MPQAYGGGIFDIGADWHSYGEVLSWFRMFESKESGTSYTGKKPVQVDYNKVLNNLTASIEYAADGSRIDKAHFTEKELLAFKKFWPKQWSATKRSESKFHRVRKPQHAGLAPFVRQYIGASYYEGSGQRPSVIDTPSLTPCLDLGDLIEQGFSVNPYILREGGILYEFDIDKDDFVPLVHSAELEEVERAKKKELEKSLGIKVYDDKLIAIGKS